MPAETCRFTKKAVYATMAVGGDTLEEWMHMALEEARAALAEGEIPVGTVLIREGQLICRAHNRREAWHDPTAHAELLCLREGARLLGDWRLRDCTLYVTLEP